MAPLTDSQEMVMCTCLIFASILSIMGSSWILSYLAQCRKLSIYHRFMLGLSASDVLHSSFFLMQPFLIPRDGGRIWAKGDDSSCSMVGFFLQLGFAAPLYNGGMNLYFMLTIVYGVTDKTFSTYVEPWLHAVAILYPLVTASVGAGIGLYSEQQLGPVCWIGEYPKGCSAEESSIPCVSTQIAWIYSGIPILGTLLFLIVSNTCIYMKVRRTTNQTRRYTENRENLVVSKRVLADVESMDDKGNHVRRSWLPKAESSNGTAPLTMSQRRARLWKESTTKRTRAVATQAFLYVGACFNTAVWSGVLKHLESRGASREDESKVYWLVIMTMITFPIQGFFNCIIFVRPRYLRWRSRSPNVTKWMAIRLALSKKSPDMGSLVPQSRRARCDVVHRFQAGVSMIRRYPIAHRSAQYGVLDSDNSMIMSPHGDLISFDENQNKDSSNDEESCSDDPMGNNTAATERSCSLSRGSLPRGSSLKKWTDPLEVENRKEQVFVYS